MFVFLYLQSFLHLGSFLQSTMQKMSDLILQGPHYALPPLDGALWESLCHALQDPKMMAQELEELLEVVHNVREEKTL